MHMRVAGQSGQLAGTHPSGDHERVVVDIGAVIGHDCAWPQRCGRDAATKVDAKRLRVTVVAGEEVRDGVDVGLEQPLV